MSIGMLRASNNDAGDPTDDELSVERTLLLLRDRSMYFASAEEWFEERDGELRRTVSIASRVPLEGYLDSRSKPAVFQFVALTPRKDTLVSFKVLSKTTAENSTARILSHDEHQELAASLISYRVQLLLATSSIDTERNDESNDFSWETLSLAWRRLAELPYLDAKTARAVIAEEFTSTGKLAALAGRTVDHDRSIRLRDLCALLAERYLLTLSLLVAGPMLSVKYEYGQQFGDSNQSWRGRLRQLFGAVPLNQKIHIPLARLANHYSAEMLAPVGHYFDQVRVLADVSPPNDQVRDSKLTIRVWNERRRRKHYTPDQADAENASNRIFAVRERGQHNRAHIFVSNGSLEGKRLFLGTKIYEIPPGSVGKATLSIMLSSVVILSFLAWYWAFLPDASETSIASLVTAFVSLGAYAAIELLPKTEAVKPPLVPRVLVYLQVLLAALFCVWLLTAPYTGETGLPWIWNDWTRDLWNLWRSWAGTVISVLLILGLLYLLKRWRRSTLRHRAVVDGTLGETVSAIS